ncbi:EFR1 family ferrodoxin [Pectinatus sottacetonis]|uniref:EFR1 family ferrodoxin n=1 Tax=Pectinatus sottacetonis TaxID=1002795 RepID=UPI0018C4D213|nr:EFR1 family ferrodoxin [Pectinatus sottacetonis]
MKTTAIYFSPTETSKKGAVAIADVLQPDAAKVDITIGQEMVEKKFSSEDLVIFGAPVYSGRIFKGIKQRLQAVQGNNTPCVVTVTYGNRDYDDALLELADIVKEKGFLPVAGAALIGQHTYGEIQVGRPDKNDINEDKKFAAKVLTKLQSGQKNTVKLPGNPDYIHNDGGNGGKFRPLTDEKKCVQCGICAQQCPEGAIDMADYSKIDNNKCIACFRCIRICPTGAKNMDTPEYKNFAADFSRKLSQPRKNEYFI